MNITGKTVLITGGGSGIGFEIARLLSKDNKVVITGRSEDRLRNAAAKLNNVSYIAADVTSEADLQNIAQRLTSEFGGLDILINNAGTAELHKLDEPGNDAYSIAAHEINTNYLSVIKTIDLLLPLLHKSPEAAIVNTTSIVAFAPGYTLPTYAASKAALHSYTRILRYSLAKTTSIKVFELMPPLVNTELSAPIGGENGIPPQQVAEELVAGFNNNEYEIHVGQTADMYKLYLSSPEQALQALNQGRE